MKKIIYILPIALLTSCYAPLENPYVKYCGKQIVEKSEAPVGKWFKFRDNEGITDRVYVVNLDWDTYREGDTIKCTGSIHDNK